MPKRRFMQVDVFTATPLLGNGLAVVLDAEGMTTEDMQRFARWTNLAETTFLLPPEDPAADYTVRIFTPGREMLFAGHPTLGSCAAWLVAGGVPKDPERVIQHCRIGPVEIDQTGEVPAFVAPDTAIAPLTEEDIARFARALDVDRDRVLRGVNLKNGPEWNMLELASAEDVIAIDSARVRYPEYLGLGVFGPWPAGGDCDFEIRNLAPSSGMSEDPITGSMNAAVARWLQAEGRLTGPVVVGQGRCVGREGRVFIRLDDAGRVLVGGQTQMLIEGTVEL